MENFRLGKQYILLLMVEGLAGIFILASMAIAARNLSTLDYSLLLTFRRDAAFLVPIVLVGLGTTLVKELAILNISKNNNLNDINHVINGGIMLSLSSFFIIFVSLTFFGSLENFLSEYRLLIFIWIFFLASNAIIFSILRGQGRYLIATVSNFLCLGLSPLCASIISINFLDFIKLNLILTAIFNIYFLVVALKNIYVPNFKIKTSIYLLRSGFHRFLADLGFNFVIWSPIFIGRIILNINDENYFGSWAFAMMILTIFIQFIFPMTTIALPEISKSVIEDNLKSALKRIFWIIFAIFIVSLVIQSTYIILGRELLILIFGDVVNNYFFQTSLIIFALPWFLVYSLNRAVIDAVYSAPVNLIITFSATLLIILGSIFLVNILDMPSSVEYIFPASITLMGFLSIMAIFGKFFLMHKSG